MSPKLLLPLFALAILLSACGTTVINEEDRELPEQPPVAAEDSSLGSTGNSSSQLSIAPMKKEGDKAEPMEYTADLSQSFIAFTGAKGNIVSHEGKFEDFDLSLTVVNGEPTALTATFNIESMVTDSEGLTTHLKSADFFDAATFPESSFVADSITSTGEDMYAITGTLNLHGVSKTEIINAKITQSYLTVNHTLDRTDYGIGGSTEGVKAVDAAVPLEIKVVFN
ncbi:MAG: YceI family protein [Candidatus Peribacter sp.]|jgi:polyisoprenoid-binding protein YceI|nr:YceI family protein [Candidatus Peribacter sp.]MBT4393046.1 YceI family protein [Candidatus Peribacter sp.]MBT4600397.1 YceI family protein [Candidatus Peribacter sp.]MBT5149355.1 YceI family protein [Candidatus Peribacter sp.]MBT5637582.1 YceI family protein [Candidatus Peribacter sp.]